MSQNFLQLNQDKSDVQMIGSKALKDLQSNILILNQSQETENLRLFLIPNQ